MGFLDIFKGGKRPDVTVTVDPAEALPGDEVRVRVRVEGELDEKAESARAGIRCVNDYLTKEYDRREHEWDIVWRAVSLHEDAADLPLQPGEHEFTFTLPTGLPPASAKAVSWWAWAKVHRSRGLDANGSTKIAVRLPSSATPAERRSIPPGPDGVGFDELPASAPEGQDLEGVLSVTPSDDVKATHVKVALTRVCSYRDDEHQLERKEDVGEVEIGGSQELAAGQTHRFPFSIKVPPNVGPTASAPHAVVEWVVTGTVARRMKSDLEARAPVVVYDGP
jgi:hypothetical protein